jgi:hypothetical protein
LIKKKKKKKMSSPSFSPNTPNKIGGGINVFGKNTLIKTTNFDWRFAIADEPIDAKVDGKRTFCIRVDKAGSDSGVMIGFTPMEEFDSSRTSGFGHPGFAGCGILLNTGDLWFPDDTGHNIINDKISKNAKEIIVVLTISNNGTKKEIRFLCDGIESKTKDVSEYLNGDRIFPAICLFNKKQVTTIPIDEIKTRTPEIERLLCEENISFGVEAETKKENKKEKKVKQVATKKTKKETKPKTTKATKKKEETKNNKEKKQKAKK